ncbi:hypothetical protein B6I21_07360 [candidate division KSB1 bacterium 4572_119]|nr:MAG: hypothetical protein B6I21_07360 [candidate division KSB1 bacterium 4572_119]
MKRKLFCWLFVITLISVIILFSTEPTLVIAKTSVSKKALTKPTFPDNMFDLRYQDVGQLYLPITNYGIHGHEVTTGTAGTIWPKGSGQAYIFGGGIWIGSIKNGNKLVSVGYNPNSGQSELVPGFEYDESHNYAFDSEGVRVLMSTDYPSRIETENLPDWPNGYYNPDPDGNPETNDADTVSAWSEAGEGYKPVTISVQDSYAWFSDADQTYKFDAAANILGLNVIQQGYAWNYFFNQNFAFMTYDIINVSGEPLQDTYLSVVVDPDVGEAEDDMVGFDESRNLAYTYDNDGREAGWSTAPGYLGYVFLESPIDPNTGEQLGLTAFRIFTIDVDPGTDVERYDVMSANGTFDIDSSPEDKRFCMPTGPFTLEPGDTVRVVVGIICARDLEALQGACDLAQQMYDQGWVSPSPPAEPKITLVPGDGKVNILWDDKAETGLDPVTGEMDFEGYRLYKSRTGIGPLGNWNPADPTNEWQLIAQWDLVDEIGNGTPINAEDMYNEYHPYDKYLGDDSGLAHLYTDNDVINGVVYHYVITSYDYGTTGLRSLECGAILGQNRESVRPGFYKSGYEDPIINQVTHAAGRSTADIQITQSPIKQDVLDAEYEITFQVNNNNKTFTVTNLTTGEVVIDKSPNLAGEEHLVDGLYLTLQDEANAGYFESSGWMEDTQTTWNFDRILPFIYSPIDYEIRFTENGSSTSFPANLTLPFEVWRIAEDTSYQAKNLLITTNGVNDSTQEMRNNLTDGDEIKIMEDYYDESSGTWRTAITGQFYINIPDTNNVAPENGAVFKFELTKPFTENDRYVFQTVAERSTPTAKMLDEIKVVPNPYIVRNTWERSKNYAQLQFINLPETCTIRIFTLAGDHVTTIEHDENTESDKLGWEWWDLLTHNNQKIASGVYFYHVDVPGVGEQIGKFAIVR